MRQFKQNQEVKTPKELVENPWLLPTEFRCGTGRLKRQFEAKKEKSASTAKTTTLPQKQE